MLHSLQGPFLHAMCSFFMLCWTSHSSAGSVSQLS